MKVFGLTWRTAAAFLAVCCASCWLVTGTNLLGPSDRPEAYFNGSSYIRISRPLSLKQIVGLSFRTCVGGELFSQRYEGHTLHVTALVDKVVVQWARPGAGPKSASLPVHTLDNEWHWVALRYQPDALMLQVDRESMMISNSSVDSWLLTSEWTGAVLLVGNVFSGCIHEGPQLEFHSPTTTANHVLFGPCPLTTDACKDHKDVLRIPPKDHCYNEPCLRHGTCISRHDRYECHCAARYTGNNCEVDRGPPCAMGPCRHGARCEEDAHGDYRCVCPPHYHGEHCELEVSLDPQCVAAPCQNNGSCSVPSPGAPYVCQCTEGFSGRNCEVNVDECAMSGAVCYHGGRCVDGDNHYTCDCTDTGYTGKQCELNVDECEAVRGVCGPGLCYDTYGGFVCVCPPPYTGERCQKVGVACASSPCAANVSCTDTEWGPVCACPACPPHSSCRAPGLCVCDPGYFGASGARPVCARPEEACGAGVCHNGATCRVLHQHVNCTCAPGYKGAYCELSAGKALAPDRCAHAPCLHALSCADTSTGVYCECEAGWSGPRCSVPVGPGGACRCGNGGTCRAGGGCECRAGWGGPACEVPADCRAAPCTPPRECVEVGGVWGCVANECGGSCNNGTCVGDVCRCPPGISGRFCDKDIDECALKPKICNNGVCVNVPGSYECYCRPGYTGDSCEQDIDECLSAPCKNNGTCLNLENNYECTCMKGFEGKDCSVNINECASSPCAAGSTCVDGIAAYSCVCQEGLTGLHCEIDIDDCESSPCANGGRCIDGLNGYTCECAGTGYSGRSCEHNIDECAPLPCRNAGTCHDLNNDYRCLCHAAYTGKNCEVDIDDCESSPCQFGGVCLERSNTSLYRPPSGPPEQVGPQPYMLLPQTFYQPFSPETAAGFECVCVLGTTGARCDVNVDECVSSPCVHGTCEDRLGGYRCACSPGYDGEHCQLDVDECDRYNPCAHGTCHDRVASYYCACAAGYGGVNCSVPLTGCDPLPCGGRGVCHPWLLHETEHRYNCSCDSGYHGDTCDKITTMSLEKSSYAEVNTSREEGYDISFRFKTTLGNGLLAMGRGLTYFFLELSSGRLNLHSSLLNKWEGVFIGSNLNDSHWQKVFVSINSSHLVLAANEEQTIYPISQNEAYNSSVTSFPSTRLGTAGSSYATLTHGPNFFVGCFQDVVVNGQWVLPEESNVTEESSASAPPSETGLRGVRAECPRTPQCAPNPCRSGGACEDRWTSYTCTCPRPYLGHMCQHNYTAATFLHESTSTSVRSPVRAWASDVARLALLSALDISMFVRTRKPTGLVFYLGSGPGSPEETMVSASLRGGELLVRLRFRAAPEEYAVGGTRLDNGHLHLIQLVRNATLVQVKLNGTEYFRKSISAAKQLDAQVLYLGGPPPPTEPTAEVSSTTPAPPPASSTSPSPAPPTAADDQYFKGIIQDVQISNGMTSYVVEFFPLSEVGLSVPPAFGEVRLDPRAVLRGVRSDDACAPLPCRHNATCTVTWNDYVCSCPRGYKGKQCEEVEFCQLQGCPLNSQCRDLKGGYECISNATFDGVNTTLTYQIKAYDELLPLDTVSIRYRSMSGGTLLSAQLVEGDETWWFAVGVHGPQVSVSWRFPGADPQQRFMRHTRDHTQWTTLELSILANQIRGSFVWESGPNVGISAALNTTAWRRLLTHGQLTLGGLADATHTDTNLTTTRTSTTTTVSGVMTTTEGVTSSTEEWTIDNSVGEYFKGCMGEVRVGGLLLAYFGEDELLVGAGAEVARGASRWALVGGRAWGAAAGLGCVLCLERDCRHGGRCADLRHSFSCACPPGYRGLHCETDVDECADHQCRNNATCRDGLNSYTCICADGFTGDFCELDIDECASSPCEHNGTCTNTEGGYRCACRGDWTGPSCRRPLRTSCRHRPCHPRAVCHDRPDPATGNNYTCACAPGFEGVHCETAFCETRPCLHGTCLSNDTEPRCWCESGYTGMYCEVEEDECALAGDLACLHQGLCVDRLAGYYCDCHNTGYQGAHCEVDVDECATGNVNCGPGECKNHDGGYTCQCGAGFCGHECKLRDPCYPPVSGPGGVRSDNVTGPCHNGGVCEQRCSDVEQYVCVCARGWGGPDCLQQMSSSESEGGSSSALVAALAAALAVGVLAAGLAALSAQARRKRATRGTYSPSGQEYCNPRAETHHALKPPPEERLIWSIVMTVEVEKEQNYLKAYQPK